MTGKEEDGEGSDHRSAVRVQPEEGDDAEMMDEEESGSSKRKQDSNCEQSDVVGTQQKPNRVYIPGVSRGLKKGEELVFDKTAYRMLHEFQLDYPCMSFDPLTDNDGSNRESYPLHCSLVAGTQAPQPRHNSLAVVKLASINPIKQSEDNDDDETDSESEDEEDRQGSGVKKVGKGPFIHVARIPHHGNTNRIRATNLGSSSVCAVWNDQVKVQIWNLTPMLKIVNEMEGGTQCEVMKKEKPLYSFVGHLAEGYALDWSKLVLGKLATGDNKSRIHIWQMREGGEWAVDQKPLAGHTGSVEDIQWSPTEDNVLCSCSSDATLRLWDARASGDSACVCTVKNAHEGDVNVVSWNGKEPFILSGGDDGELRVWDLRLIQHGNWVARFKQHTAAITSVQWHPTDSTVFMASSEDDSTSIWDLALEADEDARKTPLDKEDAVPDVPPQLLFIHMGQKEIKEVHWHPQLAGVAVTTALSGFNIFRTVNV